MSPIGESLRGAREAKGLTLERVAEETNIGRRYLTALETEDFAVFPGDPYAIGFLRNYAEYLGLTSDDLVASFRNMRIQEQPVPLQELIPARRSPVPAVAAVALVAVAVVAIAVFLMGGRGRQEAADREALAVHAPVEYRLEGATLERRLYVGDSILASVGAEDITLLVSAIDEGVSIASPVGTTRLALGEEGAVDLDKDGDAELSVLVTDLVKGGPERGAAVRIAWATGQEPVPAAAALDGGAAPGAAAVSGAAALTTAAAAPETAAVAPEPGAAAGSRTVLIFEAGKSAWPFVLSVTFRGACVFRYEVDRRDRDERYYRKGETITINASNSIKLWASNAQAAKVTIQASGGKSADVELGGPGEVAVKRIAWSQTEAGNYSLSAYDVD